MCDEINKADWDTIKAALSHLYSHQVMQATRSRRISTKFINHRDRTKSDNRIAEVRAEWCDKSQTTLTLLIKVDRLTEK